MDVSRNRGVHHTLCRWPNSTRVSIVLSPKQHKTPGLHLVSDKDVTTSPALYHLGKNRSAVLGFTSGGKPRWQSKNRMFTSFLPGSYPSCLPGSSNIIQLPVHTKHQVNVATVHLKNHILVECVDSSAEL